MATKSTIEWTELTWNPTIGCSEQSPGCLYCYAAKMAWRLMHIPAMAADYAGLAKKLPNGRIVWTGKVTALENRLSEPLLIKKPATFFVNSMSDLFHPEVPFEFIARIFAVMAITPWHTYQVLTKQPKRALEYFAQYENGLPDERQLGEMISPYWDFMHTDPKSKVYGLRKELREIGWFYDTFYSELGNDQTLTLELHGPLKNVWIGVSVENEKYVPRIDELRQIPAAVRFISYEPALGPINPDLTGIHWVICGGESGNNARPMHPDWPRSIRDQCVAAGVPFFFKQWGQHLPASQSWPEVQVKPVQFPSPNTPGKMNTYYRPGKHLAGSVLDGREWKEMPKA